MQPDFSERTFEFCYNAEFVHRLGGFLAAYPHLPSLRAERALGYDVQFRLRAGRYRRSLFLQHKIAHFGENRQWNNTDFYDAHGGPYYRFPLEDDQHNVLLRIRGHRGDAFYCAPRFHRRTDLNRYFRQRTIVPNSSWFWPQKLGVLAGGRHHISVDPAGRQAFYYSEPKPLDVRYSGGDRLPDLEEHELNEQFLRSFTEELREEYAYVSGRRQLPDALGRARDIEIIQYVLSQVLRTSWIILE